MNKNNKSTLNEGEIKRFAKLAGVNLIHEDLSPMSPEKEEVQVKLPAPESRVTDNYDQNTLNRIAQGIIDRKGKGSSFAIKGGTPEERNEFAIALDTTLNKLEVPPQRLREQTYKVGAGKGYYHVARALGLKPEKETYRMLRNIVRNQTGSTMLRTSHVFSRDPETGQIILNPDRPRGGQGIRSEVATFPEQEITGTPPKSKLTMFHPRTGKRLPYPETVHLSPQTGVWSLESELESRDPLTAVDPEIWRAVNDPEGYIQQPYDPSPSETLDPAIQALLNDLDRPMPPRDVVIPHEHVMGGHGADPPLGMGQATSYGLYDRPDLADEFTVTPVDPETGTPITQEPWTPAPPRGGMDLTKMFGPHLGRSKEEEREMRRNQIRNRTILQHLSDPSARELPSDMWERTTDEERLPPSFLQHMRENKIKIIEKVSKNLVKLLSKKSK